MEKNLEKLIGEIEKLSDEERKELKKRLEELEEKPTSKTEYRIKKSYWIIENEVSE